MGQVLISCGTGPLWKPMPGISGTHCQSHSSESGQTATPDLFRVFLPYHLDNGNSNNNNVHKHVCLRAHTHTHTHHARTHARTHAHTHAHHGNNTAEEPRRDEHDQRRAAFYGGVGWWGVGEKDGERMGTGSLHHVAAH
jgi:hypothetical protein